MNIRAILIWAPNQFGDSIEVKNISLKQIVQGSSGEVNIASCCVSVHRHLFLACVVLEHAAIVRDELKRGDYVQSKENVKGNQQES